MVQDRVGSEAGNGACRQEVGQRLDIVLAAGLHLAPPSGKAGLEAETIIVRGERNFVRIGPNRDIATGCERTGMDAADVRWTRNCADGLAKLENDRLQIATVSIGISGLQRAGAHLGTDPADIGRDRLKTIDLFCGFLGDP